MCEQAKHTLESSWLKKIKLIKINSDCIVNIWSFLEGIPSDGANISDPAQARWCEPHQSANNAGFGNMCSAHFLHMHLPVTILSGVYVI